MKYQEQIIAAACEALNTTPKFYLYIKFFWPKSNLYKCLLLAAKVEVKKPVLNWATNCQYICHHPLSCMKNENRFLS